MLFYSTCHIMREKQKEISLLGSSSTSENRFSLFLTLSQYFSFSLSLFLSHLFFFEKTRRLHAHWAPLAESPSPKTWRPWLAPGRTYFKIVKIRVRCCCRYLRGRRYFVTMKHSIFSMSPFKLFCLSTIFNGLLDHVLIK